jgi:hypothetical protein
MLLSINFILPLIDSKVFEGLGEPNRDLLCYDIKYSFPIEYILRLMTAVPFLFSLVLLV